MGFWDSFKGGMQVVAGAVNGLVRMPGATPGAGSGYRERPLTADEITSATGVFRNTVPLDRVFVANDIGLGDRPYTLPKRNAADGYVIHMGPGGFADAPRSTLIHELTHVWQSRHGRSPWAYVLDSMTHQARSLVTTRSVDGAYRYRVGQPWSSYGAEQQAMIVQDWFTANGTGMDEQPTGGESETDPRFRYVQNDIRGLRRD